MDGFRKGVGQIIKRLRRTDAQPAQPASVGSTTASEPQLSATDRRILRFKEGPDWQHGSLSRRHYASYEEYVTHQVSKLDTMRDRLELVAAETILAFRKRFELLDLTPASTILCLGARLGHEVMAFIELGHFAVGIDLYPGEGNQHVMVGDFHSLVFANSTVDCVYINSLDHILHLDKFTQEIRRVLKPSGQFVADIVYGYEEGFWAGEYEALHWPTAQRFAEELACVGNLRISSIRDLKEHGSPLWVQAVFRQA